MNMKNKYKKITFIFMGVNANNFYFIIWRENNFMKTKNASGNDFIIE
jgi:hypothetical protein